MPTTCAKHRHLHRNAWRADSTSDHQAHVQPRSCSPKAPKVLGKNRIETQVSAVSGRHSQEQALASSLVRQFFSSEGPQVLGAATMLGAGGASAALPLGEPTRGPKDRSRDPKLRRRPLPPQDWQSIELSVQRPAHGVLHSCRL